MAECPTLTTERLVLRAWRDDDVDAFAAMNADPVVMEHFPSTLTRVQTDDLVARIERHFEDHGFGLWAVEVRGGAPFIGFVGLALPNFEAFFTPAVEVGWRLAKDHWGQGYATEGAREAVRFGFEDAALAEIVSFTVLANERSQGVMRRLGLSKDGEFDHPNLPGRHPMRRHVLYRLTRADWAAGNVGA